MVEATILYTTLATAIALGMTMITFCLIYSAWFARRGFAIASTTAGVPGGHVSRFMVRRKNRRSYIMTSAMVYAHRDGGAYWFHLIWVQIELYETGLAVGTYGEGQKGATPQKRRSEHGIVRAHQ